MEGYYEGLLYQQICDEQERYRENLLTKSPKEIYDSSHQTWFYDEMLFYFESAGESFEESEYKHMWEQENILEYLWDRYLFGGAVIGGDSTYYFVQAAEQMLDNDYDM